MRQLEIQFGEGALVDLNDLFQFILERSGSEAVAEGYVSRLMSACARIGTAPEAGRPREDIATGLRTWSFERRATIAYLVGDESVIVTGIYYGGKLFDRKAHVLRAVGLRA